MTKLNRKIETFERLFEYGAWYISRYSISLKKLTFQLTRKAEDESMVEQVLQKLQPFMDDRREIESRVLGAISLGLPLRDLRSKLLTKSFQKADIDAVFANYETEFADYTVYERAIMSRIKTLQSRRYGRTRIESELTQNYPKFRTEIRGLLDLADQESADENPLEAFQSERDRLAGDDQKGRKKLFEKLIRRGFKVQDVRQFLAISEEES